MGGLEDKVDDIDKRVVVLEDKDQKREVKEAADTVRFESLCKRLDDLIALLKLCVGTAIGLGAIIATVAAAYIQAGGI